MQAGGRGAPSNWLVEVVVRSNERGGGGAAWKGEAAGLQLAIKQAKQLREGGGEEEEDGDVERILIVLLCVLVRHPSKSTAPAGSHIACPQVVAWVAN